MSKLFNRLSKKPLATAMSLLLAGAALPANAGPTVVITTNSVVSNNCSITNADISGGTLTLRADDGVPADCAVQVQGGSFNLAGHNDTVAGAQLQSGAITGAATGGPVGTLTSASAYDLQAGLASANLNGAGLVKTTGGTVTLDGTNSIDGLADVQAGILTLNGLTTAAAVNVATGATLNLGADLATGTLTSGGVIDGTGHMLSAANAIFTDGTVNANVVTTGSVVKTTNGTATLNGTNSFDALADVQAGTLTLNGLTTANGGVNVAAGATLNLGANLVANGGLSSGGTIDGTGHTLTATNANFTGGTVNADLVLTGILTTTTGTTTLNGTATTNAVDINGGTLALGANNRLSDTAALTVNGGSFDLGGHSDTVGAVTLVSGTIQNGTLTSGVNGCGGYTVQSGTVSANLAGPCGLTKTTGGTVTLSGTNTYTGTTAVNVGTLTLNGGHAILDAGAVNVATGATLNLGADETVGPLTGAANGQLTLNANTLTTGNGTDTTFAGAISGKGGIVKQGSGNFTLSGVNTYTGTTTVNAGTLTLAGGAAIADSAAVTVGAAGALNLAASETLGSVAGATGSQVTLNGNTLTTGNGTDTTFAGSVSGNGGIVKQGTGTFTLSGANTYTGTTAVNAGTLTLAGGNAIADSAAVTVGAAGTLNLAASETLGSVSGATGSQVTLNGNTLTTGNGTDTTFAGSVSGNGGIVKQGAGNFTLSGTNTYTGTTAVNAGTLTLAGGNAIADSAAVTVGAAGTLNLAASETLGSVSGATGSQVTLNGNTLTTGNSTDTTFAGSVSGNGGIVKQGAGNFTLSGTNTYTGTTTVNAGTLTLAGGNAIADSAAVIVGSAGTLNLTTNETVGALAMVAGSQATLDGNTLTTASASLSGGQTSGPGTLSISSGGAGLSVDGTVTLGGGFTVANAGNAVLASAARLQGDGSYVQTAGNTQVDGELAVAKAELRGGVLHGTGTVSGSLVNDATVQGDGGGITLAGDVTGSGNYTGQVTVSGTLSPGHDGAALVTAENLSLSPTGRLVMELGGLARGTEYDAINAKTVQLGGTFDVRLINGFTPSVGSRFDLISADSITQTFDAPFACPSGYWGDCRLRNDGANLVLSFLPKNTAQIQTLEDALPDVALRRLTPLLFQPGGVAKYNYALQQISPRQETALGELATLTAKLQTNNVTRHLMGWRAKRQGQSLGMGPVSLNINGRNLPTQWGPATGGGAGDDEGFFNGKFSGFLNGQFEFDDRNTTVQQRGYHANLYGFTAGVDYWINSNLLVGLAAVYNYTDSRLADDGGAQYLNGYGVTGFASLYLTDHWYVDLMANGTYNQFTSKRNIIYTDAVGRVNTTAYGHADGLQSHYSVNTGYDFPLQEWTLGLRGRAEYVNTPLDAYQESGAVLGLNMAYKDRSVDSLVSALGGIVSHTASTQVGVFTSQLVLEWEHQYMNSAQLAGTRFASNPVQFNTPVDGANRDYFNIRSSVSAQFANGASAFVQYDTTVGLQNLTRHAVNLGVRMEF